jgi:hypothetical protein
VTTSLQPLIEHSCAFSSVHRCHLFAIFQTTIPAGIHPSNNAVTTIAGTTFIRPDVTAEKVKAGRYKPDESPAEVWPNIRNASFASYGF